MEGRGAWWRGADSPPAIRSQPKINQVVTPFKVLGPSGVKGNCMKDWRAIKDKGGHEDPEKILRISKRWEEMPGKCSCRLETKHSKRLMCYVWCEAPPQYDL
ncbi:hypothetical protein VNO78_05452 [Psophocarpus tetragonolobus]|uniref:Uncharacterized protein n=1 Tax=Psophocarpus tetragonolobus TaxID=3891 RepID=A0AAN9SSW3_PSOTE